MSNPVWAWKDFGKCAELLCGPARATAIVHETGGFIGLDEWRGQKVRIPFRDEQLGDLELNALQLLAYAAPRFRSESLELADAHLRGSDLVATYAESGEQRVAPQVYWRAAYVEPFAAVRIELIVSIRTGLLDSEPSSLVLSSSRVDSQLFHAAALDTCRYEEIVGTVEQQLDPRLPTKIFDVSQSATNLFVIRCPELGLSYAEMMHPTDFVSAEATVDDNHVSLLSRLFPERLEKGVIRRGRICGWLMPVENDLETAVKLARAFEDEPLPLTA